MAIFFSRIKINMAGHVLYGQGLDDIKVQSGGGRARVAGDMVFSSQCPYPVTLSRTQGMSHPIKDLGASHSFQDTGPLGYSSNLM